MTCIVGYNDLESQTIFIGGDSAGTDEYHIARIHRDPKVVNNGPFVIGYTTSWRMGHLLTYKLDGPALDQMWRLRQDDLLAELGNPPSEGPYAVLDAVLEREAFLRTQRHRFLCTEFIDAVRAIFKDNGFGWKEHERETGGEFLVGWRGSLCIVEGDYGVTDVEDYFAAVGSGANHAMGALFALNANARVAIPDRLQTALMAAQRYTTSVRPPFHLLSVTKDGEVTREW
jgi:hypothetical protein